MKRRNAGILVLSCLLSSSLMLMAQQPRPAEYQVKAAYLFNFGRFANWQDASANEDTFPICVLGQDPFGASLDRVLSGQKVDGKPIVPRRVTKPQDAVDCRILFISSSEERRLEQTLDVLEGQDVLTVSDIPRFARRGGMIEFVLEGSRVRFEIDLEPVTASGLTLSSELLRVAAAVRNNPGE